MVEQPWQIWNDCYSGINLYSKWKSDLPEAAEVTVGPPLSLQGEGILNRLDGSLLYYTSRLPGVNIPPCGLTSAWEKQVSVSCGLITR